MANLDIPTPSPKPSLSASPYSLSERINIATRPVHSQLNRLILTRLPLALPPYTTNPSTYISGLLHIAPIYTTFESLWNSIINAPQLPTSLTQPLDACDPAYQIIDPKNTPIIPGEGIPKLVHIPKVSSRTNALLSHLHLPGLLRASRLRSDIRVLTGTSEHKIDKQLEAVSQNGRLAEFISHTTQSVEANPHVLLAYAWVLYMALFSGGRYLRASLREAGGSSEFWAREPSPVRPYAVTGEVAHELRNSKSDSIYATSQRPSRSKIRSESVAPDMVPGLQFFNFVGDEDGEDIKLEFKKRITEAEILLTDDEKEDIILEAQQIFKFMVEIVGELDAVMGASEVDLETARMSQSSSSITTRDSVLTTKKRLFKTRPVAIEIPKRPSFLQVLVSGPIAIVVHFNECLEAFVKPLAKCLSEKLSPGVSSNHQSDIGHSESLNNLERVRVTFLPLLVLIAVFLVWYCLA